jgi:transposase
VVRRHELTDQEWELLAPLIPRAATGRPRVSDRQVINGMVYKIRTGISWRDLPERYGPWQTVYTRFRRYALDGVFTRALQQIQARADAAGDIDWLVQIDSTIVRAHQHAAATGRKGGAHPARVKPVLKPLISGPSMPPGPVTPPPGSSTTRGEVMPDPKAGGPIAEPRKR